MQLTFLTNQTPLFNITQEGLLLPEEITQFQKLIYHYYQAHERIFSWRHTNNPYHVLVSEIMLQQTQTQRVAQKYPEFIAQFPTVTDLAKASFKDVLSAWQGLGYNRRAQALHSIAQELVTIHEGKLPDNPIILATFKGIGPNTAGSLCAFAYNKPVTFIETNIRAVFIHCFYHDHLHINDKLLLPLIEQTVDRDNPRIWYYALMDYGVMLKKKFKNPNKKSAHYTKQSRFEGSKRQIRSRILKLVLQQTTVTTQEIQKRLALEEEVIETILAELEKEKLILKKDSSYTIFSTTEPLYR